jgi:hypothetical protein
LHMFHLAFSSGEEHASAAFHSIARAQSRGFEPGWPSIDEVEPSLRDRGGPRRHRLTAQPSAPTFAAQGFLFGARQEALVMRRLASPRR